MEYVDDLRQALGDDNVLEEPIELHIYSKDASLMRGHANAVVFPKNADDVARIVRIAEANKVPIVARGAGTGLVGDVTPSPTP